MFSIKCKCYRIGDMKTGKLRKKGGGCNEARSVTRGEASPEEDEHELN